MKTVNEVSKLTGVSIRTLQYYDQIGLLKPAEYAESGYRLYDDAALVSKHCQREDNRYGYPRRYLRRLQLGLYLQGKEKPL